jgi:general stress protein 26
MKNASKLNRDTSIQKLSELISGIKVAMFTTLTDDKGVLHTRPMITQSFEIDGTLWFFTRLESPKSDEVRKDNHVAISYCDPEDNRYVSVYGRAEILQDKEQAEKIWTPSLGEWFPRGLDDPELALMRVEVDRAEYWDIGLGKMIPLETEEVSPRNEKLDLAG